MRAIELSINLFAQDKLILKDLLEQFNSLESTQDKKELVKTAGIFLEQAHPDIACIEQGINSIPLKPTMTPVILLKTQALKIAISKITELPDNELEKSFIALVSLFKIADTERRNTSCKDGCTHEWHNLAFNENV